MKSILIDHTVNDSFLALIAKSEPAVIFQICNFLHLQADLVQAYSSKNAELANLAEAIEGEKKEQWRLEGRSHLFDAKRVSQEII